MSSPSQAHIIEVGTRDGIQAEKQFVETDQKLRMLELILAAGVRRVEVTSFVRTRHVPQMADAEAVLTGMDRPPGVEVEALVMLTATPRAPEAQGASGSTARRPASA